MVVESDSTLADITGKLQASSSITDDDSTLASIIGFAYASALVADSDSTSASVGGMGKLDATGMTTEVDDASAVRLLNGPSIFDIPAQVIASPIEITSTVFSPLDTMQVIKGGD
jgi:hypothetical protein